MAWRRAVFTVDRDTPAIAAIFSSGMVHCACRATSAATAANAAHSAIVNRHASCGGSHPEAVQRRRRSIDSEDRGLDP